MQILSVRGALPEHRHPQEEIVEALAGEGIGPAQARTAVADNRLAGPA